MALWRGRIDPVQFPEVNDRVYSPAFILIVIVLILNSLARSIAEVMEDSGRIGNGHCFG